MTSSAPYRRAYVEISNVCNLQCSFCPPVERDKRQMSADAFARVASQLPGLVDEVCLHLMGEPLNHPDVGSVLDLCSEHRLPVNLTTNGLLLTGERRETALSPIVRQVNISAHSFAANFPDRDPGPYAERLLAFLRAAEERRPDLYVNLRFWDQSAPDQTDQTDHQTGDGDPNNRRILEHLGAAFAVPLARPDLRRRKSVRLAGRMYVHFDSRFTWPSPKLPVRATTGFCHGLTSHFGVLADGTVVPCCLDKEAALALGNCTDTPLAEILAGPRAAAMRAGFARGELVEDFCRRCPFVARFDRKAKRIAARHAP